MLLRAASRRAFSRPNSGAAPRTGTGTCPYLPIDRTAKTSANKPTATDITVRGLPRSALGEGVSGRGDRGCSDRGRAAAGSRTRRGRVRCAAVARAGRATGTVPIIRFSTQAIATSDPMITPKAVGAATANTTKVFTGSTPVRRAVPARPAC